MIIYDNKIVVNQPKIFLQKFVISFGGQFENIYFDNK